MAPELINIALIVYGLYIHKKYRDPWAMPFIALMSTGLLASMWEIYSINYVELSAEARNLEATTMSTVRRIVIAILLGWTILELAPSFKNKLSKFSLKSRSHP